MSASVATRAKRTEDEAIGPSHETSVSTWWMPSCRSGPPGLRSRCAHHAVGADLEHLAGHRPKIRSTVGHRGTGARPDARRTFFVRVNSLSVSTASSRPKPLAL